MKKYLIHLLAIGLIMLSACTNQKLNNNGVVEINITEALENKKDFPLSELVKDVEILELESNIDCYIKSPHLMFFGEKHILIYDLDEMQLFLFNRNGKFMKRIGRSGNGPGEYYGMQLQGTMSKDENHIIITNSQASIVIVYNTSGEVLAQKDLSKNFSVKYIQGMACHFDNLITFLPHRPWAASDGFSSLVLFDLALNKVGEVLPRANDDNLIPGDIRHNHIFANKEGAFFWEMYNDTVFQYFENGSSTPRYKFTIEKDNLTKDIISNSALGRGIYEYTFPWTVHFISGYLVADIVKENQTVLYNQKTGESFSIASKPSCLIDDGDSRNAVNTMKNDVFGFEPPRLWFYYHQQNLIVQQFEWGRISDTKDLDCIRQLDVTHPDIRDKLAEYCENPSDDLSVVLVLMHTR